jgi:four helix bundle protein
MQTSRLQSESYSFALELVKEVFTIQKTAREFILSKQLIRSGTSIGANINEAYGAFSKKEFAYKLSISYRESLETQYWLNLLNDLSLMDPKKAEVFLKKCISLTIMLRKAINTAS